MRGDQPVVSAASLMVRASIAGRNLTTVVSRFDGDLFGGEDDLAPAAVGVLVEPDDRPQCRIGADQPLEDLVLGHRVVALPGLGHLDRRARPRAAGVLLGLALGLADRRRLPARRLVPGGPARLLRRGLLDRRPALG